MRHRKRGRILGRNASHRKAMFQNMAASLIKSVSPEEDMPNRPKVLGRIVTTVAKAKELRPFIEKIITLARRAKEHEEEAARFSTSAARNSSEWKAWRDSDKWQKWNNAISPAVTIRRRAFALLRDKEAVTVLFRDLAPRFQTRPGGYTRVVRLATYRLGDAGKQAFIEFVGERDRVRYKRQAPPVVTTPDEPVAPQVEAVTPAAESASENAGS